MSWSNFLGDGESYLASFPKLNRWINRCVACGRVGHKPELPEHVGQPHFNLGASTLRRLFEPLEVDENGVCDQCQLANERLKANAPDQQA